MSEQIAFIGVGNMGNPMAQNLVKAGKKVKVFDVSKKMIELAKEKKLDVVENLDDLCFLQYLNCFLLLSRPCFLIHQRP